LSPQRSSLATEKPEGRSNGRPFLSQTARDTGLGRESLYKALSPGGKPEFATVLKVVRALGLKLHAKPKHV
jgi:probable addiction module antidote protein